MKDKKNFFANGVKDARKAKEEIKRINEKRQKEGKEPLNEIQKRKAIRRVTEREVTKRKIKVFLGALGLTTFITGMGVGRLTAGNEGINNSKSEITIDAEIAGKDVKINHISDRNVFLENIKVDKETLEKVEEMKDSTLEANVEKEINQLQTPDEVLTYLKTIYAKEYNEENQTNITPEDIKINRTSEMTKLVEDTDKNGNTIIRTKTSEDENKKEVDISAGVITVKVQDPKTGEIEKQMILHETNGKYTRVYEDNEEVKSDEENALTKTGALIDKGISWESSMTQEKTSDKVKEQYKQDMIKAVSSYKENKIEEIKNEEFIK